VVVVVALVLNFVAVNKIHDFFTQYGFTLVSDKSLPLLIGAAAAALMMLVNSIVLRISLR
jgi:hypothetical protein